MLSNLIDSNILFLQNHGIEMKTEDDKEIYRYGLQIIYSYLVNISIIFSIALCFNKLYETVIMTFVFAILQVFGGGYHANTKLKCLLIMILGCFVGNILIISIADKLILNIILTVALNTVILILAPTINVNHPINRKIFKRSKLIVKFVICLLSLITFLLIILNKNIELATITITLSLYCISLSISKVIRGDENSL